MHRMRTPRSGWTQVVSYAALFSTVAALCVFATGCDDERETKGTYNLRTLLDEPDADFDWVPKKLPVATAAPGDVLWIGDLRLTLPSGWSLAIASRDAAADDGRSHVDGQTASGVGFRISYRPGSSWLASPPGGLRKTIALHEVDSDAFLRQFADDWALWTAALATRASEPGDLKAMIPPERVLLDMKTVYRPPMWRMEANRLAAYAMFLPPEVMNTGGAGLFMDVFDRQGTYRGELSVRFAQELGPTQCAKLGSQLLTHSEYADLNQ